MNLWLRCPALHNCSWTMVWKELLDSMKAIGHDVYDDYVNLPNKKDIELYWGNPAEFKWGKSKFKVAYVLSEAESIQSSGRDKAIKNLGKADLIICPSEYSARAYYELPIDKPIEIVYLGYNPDKIYYVERDWSRRPFKFLLAGAAQFRKGTWLGIEAFIKAFKSKKKATLTVHSAVLTPDFVEYKNTYSADNVIFDNTQVDNMLDVYKDHHVLVSPHLSEGFGLMILEAMATGMPCIISRSSSPREFFNKDFGYWIEMSDDYVPVSKCLKDTSGFWRLPDIDDLSNKLKMAYFGRRLCAIKGFEACAFSRSKMTWNNTAINLTDVIGRYYE